jgi:branched-chain amino acid aminotransferase
VISPRSSLFTFRDERDDDRGVPFGCSSFQHGLAVFEGIRCYSSAIFRLDEHLSRLLASARLLGLSHYYTLDYLRAAVLRAATASSLPDSYLRPVIYTPDPYLTVDAAALDFTLAIEVWGCQPETGRPATSGGDQPPGARLTISDWRRPSPSSFPPRAKATGMYVTSALAKTAAARAGCDDAIQLDPDSGRVAEATSANVFLVCDGELRTPWLEDSLLAGITRDSMLALARELGIPVREEPVEVAALLAADEVFLTGTAAELVPVGSIDDRRYDAARPVFTALAGAFRDAVSGATFGQLNWLTPVLPAPTVDGYPPARSAAPSR